MARGQSAIMIQTGNQPLRVGLAPAAGPLGFGILSDSVDYDRLVQAEMDDDLEVPLLAPEAEQLRLFSNTSGDPA